MYLLFKVKKICAILGIGFVFIFFGTSISFGASKPLTGYVPLAPIPGLTQTDSDKIPTTNVELYLKQLYIFGIGLASILAVLVIIWGGIEYITTDAIGHKEEGKEKIQSAIMGLMLAFGSYVILHTINQDLTSIDFHLWKANLTIKSVVAPSASDAMVGGAVDAATGAIGNYVPGGTINGGGVAVADGTPFSPNLTGYSPAAGGDKMEGGYESSKVGLDGTNQVRTLDDVANGTSQYVTLAGDPSQYGKTYVIPSITYINSSGETQTLTNVTGYVHDTGSAFADAGTSHFDVAVGRDYGNKTMTTSNGKQAVILNSQPFSGGSTAIVGGKITKP